MLNFSKCSLSALFINISIFIRMSKSIKKTLSLFNPLLDKNQSFFNIFLFALPESLSKNSPQSQESAAIEDAILQRRSSHRSPFTEYHFSCFACFRRTLRKCCPPDGRAFSPRFRYRYIPRKGRKVNIRVRETTGCER